MKRVGLGMAPRVGLEPTTLRLTAACSTIELSGSGSTRDPPAYRARDRARGNPAGAGGGGTAEAHGAHRGQTRVALASLVLLGSVPEPLARAPWVGPRIPRSCSLGQAPHTSR